MKKQCFSEEQIVRILREAETSFEWILPYDTRGENFRAHYNHCVQVISW